MNTDNYQYTLLLQGHGYGEIYGLAMHPTKNIFATGGDDGTVRLWDMHSKRPIVIRNLVSRAFPIHSVSSIIQQLIIRSILCYLQGSKARSLDFHPDGTKLAIGLSSGGFAILHAESLDTLQSKRDREEAIQVIKYSPNGLYLAVGSYDNYIDIYDLSKNYGRVGRGTRTHHLERGETSRN